MIVILVYSNNSIFESAVKKDKNKRYWSARDLQELLGYTKWQNFEVVIEKAKQSCKTLKIRSSYHFTEVSKTIEMPKMASKEIKDYHLTKHACYLIAMQGDSSKQEIALAQHYFAISTIQNEASKSKLRQNSIDNRNTFTDVLVAHNVNSNNRFGVKNITNLTYKKVLCGTAKQLKNEKCLAKKDSLRDNLSRSDLFLISFAENLSSDYIEDNEVYDYYPIKNAVEGVTDDLIDMVKTIKNKKYLQLT